MADLIGSLNRAARTFGQCAKAVENNNGPAVLSVAAYERLIGFGICCDWLGWARQLKDLTYSQKARAKSERAYGMTELSRFTFAWTAANALFSRTAILELLDPTPETRRSELERFRVLFEHSGLPASAIRAHEVNLQSILALPMHVGYFPWPAINTPPTILEVIYFKYMVASEQGRGIGRKLLRAAATNNYSELDLPTLVYATRNWNIHGVLLSSSFRGTRKKFNFWIDTVNLSLAQMLEGTATSLHFAL